MSPILKRDVHEQLRQAKRLAQAITGSSHTHHNGDGEYDFEYGHGDSYAAGPSTSPPSTGIGIGVHGAIHDHGAVQRSVEIYTSSSHPRRGIGVRDVEVQDEGAWRGAMVAERAVEEEGEGSEEGKTTREWEYDTAEEDEWVDEAGLRREEQKSLFPQSYPHELDGCAGSIGQHSTYPPRTPALPHIVSPGSASNSGKEEVAGPISPLSDLRNLLFESTPSLLFSLVGLVFTGELLEHLAHWRVFRRVDELFILVPMLGNLNGNLEMCLSARLGTSASIGELDHRRTRRALLLANMTLLGLQALLISSLAGMISFVLGLVTVHRLGDGSNPVLLDPGLAVGEQEWHEGYTRPGFKQLVMVLATGMAAAGLSSAVLGSFMSSVIVTCRWMGIDPDNITPPVASCLGDLLTLFILALIGSALVGVMDTPIPLVAVILMSIAAGWFTKRVLRNEWVRGVARGGWFPLVGAMCISSGTGMVLDRGVERYRGFALLAVSMTGLTGSIGAIHANRLSTSLHTNLHPASLHPRPNRGLPPLYRALTLYLIAFPCEALFLGFVRWAGWIDLSLSWAGWMAFALAAALSLVLAHYLTLFFWSKDLDPDSYTLPIHSALVDFMGQLLLMLAYEICIAQNLDVQTKDR